MKKVLIAVNLRSCENVGSLIRSIDGLGWNELICVGTTPYPLINDDYRLPHIREKVSNKIAKTALGAEKTVPVRYFSALETAVSALRGESYSLIALEQSPTKTPLAAVPEQGNIALLVGNEVTGLTQSDLKQVDKIVEIPMKGQKESLNVAVAAAIAMYVI